MTARRLPLASGALLLASACLSDLSIPEDTLIACEKGDTCPNGLVCAEAIGRCVDPALVNLDGIDVSVESAPALDTLSDVEGFDTTTVVFLVSRKPDASKNDAAGFRAHADDDEFPCDESDADGDAVRYTCTLSAPPGRDDGEMSVFGVATDELGEESSAWVRVALDRTPPSALADRAAVEHIPADDNLRAGSFAPASTYGGVARVQLVFDEPVALSDVALGAFGTDDVSPGPALTFTVRVPLPRATDPGAASLVDGALALTATATDLVGNTSDITLDALVAVDVTPPAALDGASDAFVLRRTPWGAAEGDAGARALAPPHTEVRVSTAALSVDVDAVRVSRAGETAAVRPVADADTFDIPLLTDVRRVEVSAVDAAGNVSAPSDVLHVEWIASLAGKVPGSTFENPHVAYDVGNLGPSLFGAATSEAGAPGQLVVDDDDARTLALRRGWARTGSGALPGRAFAAAAFDDARGRVVLTNGQFVSGDRAVTTELIGDAWVERSIETPPARNAMACASDRQRGVVVAFGGMEVGQARADTWVYDGAQWTRSPAEGPPARFGATMAYDAVRGVIVLFGGAASTAMPESRADTWEFDGTGWVERTPAVSPPGRRFAAMAWDEAGQRIVLHGGTTDPFWDSALDDTWAYQDGVWTSLGASGRPRVGPAMAFDPVRERLVMFGGDGMDDFNPDAPSGFVELGDDDVWTVIDDGGVRPPRRSHAHLVTDRARERVVLVSGKPTPYFKPGGTYAVLDDAWTWDGVRWQPLRASEQLPMIPAALAFDPIEGEVIGYGGRLAGGGTGVGNQSTWFDGAAWRAAPTSLSDPPAVRAAIAPFDGGLVLFTPDDPERTRGWYGYGWFAFSDNSGLGIRADAPLGMAAAPPARGESAVLVGQDASNAGVTWLFSDATYAWELICHTGLGGLCPITGTIAYDPVRQLDIAVDAQGTWELDGTLWTLRNDIDTPMVDASAQLAWDDGAGRILLAREVNGAPALAELVDDAWRPIEASDAPLRAGGRFTYDPVSGRPLWVGGLVGGVTVAETWALAPARRPAELLRFAFGAAGNDTVSLLEAHLDVVAGASGPGADGVELLAWSDGAFVSLATSMAALASPAPLRGTSDAGTLTAQVFGSERALYFAVAPRAIGADASTLALDEVTLTVRYRLEP